MKSMMLLFSSTTKTVNIVATKHKRNNQQYNVGYYKTIEDAIAARDQFIKELQNEC